MHARIENGAVAEYPIINLRQRLPDVSLPSDLTDDSALPEGYVCVKPAAFPQHDPATQRVVGIGPVLNGDHWEQGYEVIDLTAEEIAANAEQRKQAAYAARRDAYSMESDPIYFQWKRGKATEQDWLDKIAEIKARFPDA